MRSRVWIAVFATATQIGCAGPQAPPSPTAEERQRQFDESLSGWHGKNISGLIVKAGAPTSTYPLPDGTTLYTFDKSFLAPGWAGGAPILLTCIVKVQATAAGFVIQHSVQGC